MSALANLRQKVVNIKNAIAVTQARMAEVERKKNTTAICAEYRSGKVHINGVDYTCAKASKDIILQDGCSVYVLPTGTGQYVIIGGGI